MKKSTYQIVRLALISDESISDKQRAVILDCLTTSESKELLPVIEVPKERIIKRKHIAKMFSCSLRTIDMMARKGVLHRVIFPGNKRAFGFRESEVQALMANT
jgi:predicted DNA-binding transcriptional regulator AlpA